MATTAELEEFEGVMASLQLPPPLLLHVAVPANLRDGELLLSDGSLHPDVAAPPPELGGAGCRQDGGDLPESFSWCI